MKFENRALLLFTILCGATALNGVDITKINRPHALQIVERDLPAEIQVLDSDTVPIEDSGKKTALVASSSGAPEKPHAQVLVTDTSGSFKSSQLTTTSTNQQESQQKGQQIESDDSQASNSPFFMSISMIVVSEIGDKTFLISALMAMRHPRIIVFSAAFASLAVMTILSGIVGHALPSLVSQRVTQFLAAGLFIFFGFKLTKEGLAMSKDLGVEEELAEVEDEIAIGDINNDLNDVEAGGRQSELHKTTKLQILIQTTVGYFNVIASQVFSPLWIQVFVMIFLGEWGDRSQIATIAMAAGSDYWAVIWGAVIGHGLCTGASVIGGKMLASRISLRTVTLGGAFAFFIFSILYFYEAITYSGA